MTTLSRGIRIGVASTDQNPILIYIYSVPDGGHPASVRAVLMQIFNYLNILNLRIIYVFNIY